jgi:hypothetical protein
MIGPVEGVDQLVPDADAHIDKDETITMIDQVSEDRDIAVRRTRTLRRSLRRVDMRRVQSRETVTTPTNIRTCGQSVPRALGCGCRILVRAC